MNNDFSGSTTGGQPCHLATRFRYRIAAIVPCHNEEVAVAKVVRDLRAAVPGITVYVYDNRSTDRTAERARAAGAVVCHEPLKGKGNVVRRAFADIDADIYLLIDGDDTYDAFAAPAMIERLVSENLDQVVGVRRQVEGLDGSAYRPNHELGNRVLNRIVCAIFGDSMGDMLSGYRVFSRRFVQELPGRVAGVRDRDRADRPLAGAADPVGHGRRWTSATAPRAASPSCAPTATAGGSST